MDYVAEDENDLNQGLLTFEQKRVLSETRIAVKLVEMTRLIAHDQNGTPVYSPIEAPVLSLYANFAGAFKHLEPMTEGQTVSLASMNTVSVPSPGYGGSLVLIFAVIQSDASDEEGSAFVVLPITPNFAGGRLRDHGRHFGTVTRDSSVAGRAPQPILTQKTPSADRVIVCDKHWCDIYVIESRLSLCIWLLDECVPKACAIHQGPIVAHFRSSFGRFVPANTVNPTHLRVLRGL